MAIPIQVNCSTGGKEGNALEEQQLYATFSNCTDKLQATNCVIKNMVQSLTQTS